MAPAESVARYFLWLAAGEAEPEPVTHLRLQKLLYYAQGWALAGRGAPLFDGVVEAWPHGPVVREVYPKFADYGRDGIPESQAAEDPGLSDRDKRFIEWVWDAYGKYAAWQLRDMTHREAPWTEARRRMPEGAASRAVIENEAMRDYFTSQQAARCRNLGIDPAQFAAAMQEAREGRGVPLDRMFAGLADGMAD